MPALFTGMKSLPVGLQDVSPDIRSTGIATPSFQDNAMICSWRRSPNIEITFAREKS